MFVRTKGTCVRIAVDITYMHLRKYPYISANGTYVKTSLQETIYLVDS